MSAVTREEMSERASEGRAGEARSPVAIASGAPFAAALVLAAAAGSAIALAPTEATMGHSQRVLYVHVAVAWLTLAGFVGVAGAGVLYLLRRDLARDRWAQAAAEVGWVCSCLTLATGSLWAHEAWGTWWTWDPRLVSSFVLWSFYGGYLTVRSAIDDPHARARVGAMLAVVGAIDVPMVVMATRWFRALHPVSPELEPLMRTAPVLSVVAFTGLAVLLVACRRGQLEVHERLRKLEAADAE